MDNSRISKSSIMTKGNFLGSKWIQKDTDFGGADIRDVRLQQCLFDCSLKMPAGCD